MRLLFREKNQSLYTVSKFFSQTDMLLCNRKYKAAQTHSKRYALLISNGHRFVEANSLSSATHFYQDQNYPLKNRALV